MGDIILAGYQTSQTLAELPCPHVWQPPFYILVTAGPLPWFL